MNEDKVAVIILAAGQSTRFGSSKMSHRLANGMSLLATIVAQYQAAFTNVSVVLPKGSPLVGELVNSRVKLAFNTQPDLGMSQSIISGIRSQPNANAWLIALGDMPYIDSNTLQRCVVMSSPNCIVVPRYNGTTGHPVIFGSAFLNELMLLKGDVGAKKVIESNNNQVFFVDINDVGILHDIDKPEDIAFE